MDVVAYLLEISITKPLLLGRVVTAILKLWK